MSYDCSVTNRKGCNYCLKMKELIDDNNADIFIDDNDCNGNAHLTIGVILEEYYYNKKMPINYCPICGKKLK
jgi:glutaredoxin